MSRGGAIKRPGLRRLGQALLLLLAFAASLSLAEIALRQFRPQSLTPFGGYDPTGLRIYDPALGVAHAANVSVPWVRGVVVTTNSLGLRDREYGPKSDNELRILSLGDSYAFGYGVELSDSYPKRLEAMLAADFPDRQVSVINAAVSGYNTHQQQILFDRLFTRLQPDFVLATFVGSNDVAENARFAEALEQRVHNPPGWLGWHSHLVRLVERAAFPLTFLVSNRWGPNIDHTLAALGELTGRFEADQVPYLMIVIPARHQLRPEVHLVTRIAARVGLDDLILRQNRRVMDYFDKAGIPYVDVLPALARRDRVEEVTFPDDSHPNPLGHQVIAEAIHPTLSRALASLAPSAAPPSVPGPGKRELRRPRI